MYAKQSRVISFWYLTSLVNLAFLRSDSFSSDKNWITSGIDFYCCSNLYMNGRNTGKRYLSTLSYGLESCFKRSLVSPLCIYIIPSYCKNARWDVVQSNQFFFLQYADSVILHNILLDFLLTLWYADYVGAVIGTASYCADFNTFPTGFVNFHMETFWNPEIIG